MTRIRRVGAIMVAAPLAMAFPVATAPSAAAETTVIAPKDGTVIKSGSSVKAVGEFDFGLDRELRADIPGSGDIFLNESFFPDKMTGRIPLRHNGRYKVYLRDGVNNVRASSTFTVRIPPAQPSGVKAKASGGKLVVTWNLGLEDDISGYTVSAGSAGSKKGSDGSLCSGTNCKATFNVPASASGALPVKVRAKRPDGLGGSISSSVASTSVSVGSAPSSGGADTVGALPGTAPSSETTPLTPFNEESPVTLPSVQPDGASQGFVYPTPKVADDARPKAANASAAQSLQWGRSIGIALILLVVAAHLGTWTRRLRVAQAGVSGQGKAVRIARGGSGRSRVRRAREQIARAEAVAKTRELPLDVAGKSSGSGAAGGGAARRRPATLGGEKGVNARLSRPGPGVSRSTPGAKGARGRSRGRRRK